MKFNFRRSLLAIIAGNLIYYSVQKYLPPVARHQIYHVDFGLAIDFLLCVACYALVRLVW